MSGMTLNNTIFNYNYGPEYGGAVYTEAGATIRGITLKGNKADYGGGLYNDDVMTLTGGSFSNNSAETAAGCTTRTRRRWTPPRSSRTPRPRPAAASTRHGTFAHLNSSRVMFNHAPLR